MATNPFKEMSEKEKAPKFKYKVLINTSDLANADYDGNACVEIYGSKGKTPLYEVSGPFKRGMVRRSSMPSPPPPPFAAEEPCSPLHGLLLLLFLLPLLFLITAVTCSCVPWG